MPQVLSTHAIVKCLKYKSSYKKMFKVHFFKNIAITILQLS